MNEQTLSQRIKELEGSVQKARLEAMKLAASLLTKSNSMLASRGHNEKRRGDLEAMRARYLGLVKQADDAQAEIDKLQAEEHTKKYHR